MSCKLYFKSTHHAKWLHFTCYICIYFLYFLSWLLSNHLIVTVKLIIATVLASFSNVAYILWTDHMFNIQNPDLKNNYSCIYVLTYCMYLVTFNHCSPWQNTCILLAGVKENKTQCLHFRPLWPFPWKRKREAKPKASGTETGPNFCCTLQIAWFVMCLIWKSSSAVFSLSALVEEGSHRGVPETSL